MINLKFNSDNIFGIDFSNDVYINLTQEKIIEILEVLIKKEVYYKNMDIFNINNFYFIINDKRNINSLDYIDFEDKYNHWNIFEIKINIIKRPLNFQICDNNNNNNKFLKVNDTLFIKLIKIDNIDFNLNELRLVPYVNLKNNNLDIDLFLEKTLIIIKNNNYKNYSKITCKISNINCIFNEYNYSIENIRLKENHLIDNFIYKLTTIEYNLIIKDKLDYQNTFNENSIEYNKEHYITKNSYWTIIIKPLVKILSLHKRAIERVYHPKRLKAEGYFDILD